eukprot:3699519-Rhodomonas_salina.2
MAALMNVETVPACLRARYAISGTDLAYGAIVQCARYAMSGIDLGQGSILLCARYAMLGTDLG